MTDLDLCYLSGSEALQRFRKRTLSPVELLQALIARAEQVETKVNALPMKHYDYALGEARKAEARYMKTDGRIRPLEGLALAVKDESAIKGWRTTFGSLIYKDNIDQVTHPCVDRLLKAGAIVHARSAAPEFSCAPFAHSKLWGITRTPWNLDYSCGGSSGGAGASLASGTTTLATGSDIGGSIRIPASMSGVCGYKPPFGRNPEGPPFNLDQYCHFGPLARTVADIALFQNVVAGPHPIDLVSLRPKLRIPATLGDIKGWKIGLTVDYGCYDVEPDVIRNTRAAADAFREAGAIVEEVELGWDREKIAAAGWAHFGAIFGTWVARVIAEHRDEMTDYAVHFGERANRMKKEDFLAGLEYEGEMYLSLGKLMQKYRILLCPTLPLPAVVAGESYVDRKPIIDNKPQESLLHWLTTAVFNILSRCPVMSMPSGLASNGVPTGLSIVGRTYDDVSVFRAARAYETQAGAWYASGDRRPPL
ncbi:MAG: amidase [Rhodospirillaceae bacterium]|nr:amidase [Rhodospirillaceae bacterium]